jgi:asparagine synthase (glutamine-hydrolysing)
MTRSASLLPADRFLRDSVYLADDERTQLVRDNGTRGLESEDVRIRHLEYFSKVENADFLNQMLYVDAKTFMVSLNLNYTDKMSMASSIEVRVPFLDRELAEWTAWHVPPAQKLHAGTTKHILRQAMRNDLPVEVLHQPKAGFGAPIDYWLCSELAEMVDDVLSERQIEQRGIFSPAVVRRMVQEHRSGREDWSYPVWAILTLELWMRSFFDQTEIDCPTASYNGVPATAGS